MMSNLEVDLSTFDNRWYRPGSLLKRSIWYLTSAIVFECPLPLPCFFKICLLRIFGANIGNNVTIKPKVRIKYPWFLKIGSNVWLGEGTWIDNLAPVEIGNNVCVSQGAYLLTGNHDYKSTSFDLITEEIVLEAGAWIGAKVIVCPGVRLKSHSVVTAGSVVYEDTEPFTVYQGNPAISIRKRTLRKNSLKEDV